jgi:hypothetical protein
MKRKTTIYVVLFLFGGTCFSLGAHWAYRPEWAQIGIVAFWAFVAWLFVDGATSSSRR